MTHWNDNLILPYFQLRLTALLPGKEDLAAALTQPELPNLSLLKELHPYEPQAVTNHILAQLQFTPNHRAWINYSSDIEARRIAVREKINRDKMLFWLQELQADRRCRYFLLQAPYELLDHQPWHQSIVVSLSEAFGGGGYHDYDTGRILEEYRFIEPATKQVLLKLLLCLTFDEIWWDGDLTLQRSDIDRLVNIIAHLTLQ